MKVLLTGAGGQLGQALCDSVPQGLELIATGRQQLNLADAQACRAAVEQHRPDWVLNAGAYTAVDKAESQPELAQAVNAGAPRAFAEALAERGGRLLQVSTDFVFNGQQGHPYQSTQPRQPLGIYGLSKAAGEEALEATLGCGVAGAATILRTSWVYGPVGRNFLLTMLRLHRLKAEAGEPLLVVADQVGCPTSTFGLAEACWAVIQQQVAGIHHWSDAGVASWYDFSVAIGELAVARGLIPKAAKVQPITAAEYPTPAQRPAYSLLACADTRRQLQRQPQHWRAALEEVIRHVEA
ncbi:dTDP-4-dehydrorhamnose reductase [Synechococcus sp. A18-25c]|uniref:dTDP-4-dehydrorhamnose reductase n=1 Tax=Synechococcus sp. A18-25c TaxID=1866938 RepID=UPI001645F160|nr:dTDP-4-dehydrorhamnose reductase [Synechococcus sp. A18-25c]